MAKELKQEKSTGLQEEEEMNEEKKDLNYEDKDLENFKFYIGKIEKARQQRDTIYQEFDDMTYEQDYATNKKAAYSYLKRKRNDDEVRIVGGTTEKKIDSVATELYSLNLQPEVIAYDEFDNELSTLGFEMSDIVKRTNEMERDDDMYEDSIDELLTQRAVFIEELFTEREVKDKRSNKKMDLGNLDDVILKAKARKITRTEKRLLDGRQVYLGNITLPAYRFNEQPYIIKYDRMLYSEAKQIYGEWDQWDKVKAGGERGTLANFKGDFKWRMNTINKDEVEILKYFNYPDDEYQVIINGVMMLNPGTPLPWEKEGYNISMTVLKGIKGLAYGKPLTASAKTLQGLDDEMMRLIIYKWRQAIFPPSTTKTKMVLSRDMYAPSAITHGVKKGDINRLIEHDGVTQSEMAVNQFINDKTKEFIGSSDLQQGIEGQKKTARETVILRQQGIKNLGRAILALSRMKRDMTYLRIYNIIENYSMPERNKFDEISKQVVKWYKRFTIKDATFENNKRGTKIIQLMDRDLDDTERQDIKDFSDEQEKRGNPMRIQTINIKKLREVFTIWFVNVRQTEKEGSDMQKILFDDKLEEGAKITQLTGRRVNDDAVVDDFERTWNVKDYFKKTPEGGETQEQGVQNEAENILKGAEKLESGAEGLKPNKENKPTINQSIGGEGI